MPIQQFAGHLWLVTYVHHYTAVAKYDGKEHDYRDNGSAFVMARTTEDALRLFREKYPDTSAYVVHNVTDRGGSKEIIAEATPSESTEGQQ